MFPNQVRCKADCTATEDGKMLYMYRAYTTHVAKTKTLVGCAVTAQLICAFVFTHICKKKGFLMTRLNRYMCSTVSSMVSGLETMSLGLLKHIRHNVVSSLVTVCPSQPYVNGFLGLTSTKQGVNVTCSSPQRTATQPDLEPGTPWSIVWTLCPLDF